MLAGWGFLRLHHLTGVTLLQITALGQLVLVPLHQHTVQVVPLAIVQPTPSPPPAILPPHQHTVQVPLDIVQPPPPAILPPHRATPPPLPVTHPHHLVTRCNGGQDYKGYGVRAT
ncbi:hypothetical protein L1987_74843 [Smallanthus sonchifolius]|uniref:Uncharacterized protein n=1 Tax=Smallanthus sonchifolius TaxID=185202 RepID=A0ACB9A328_9ASTR|nr:hypothetical protein L1987_74843 [Smallanthus sonchifolius]